MGLGIVIGTQFPSDKAKYGGLEVSDAKRLKALEDENTKLKRLSAEAMLDSAMLRRISPQKRMARPIARDLCGMIGSVCINLEQ